MIVRTIKCCVENCEAQQTEAHPGEGWQGWGQLSGISVAVGGIAVDNPNLCPSHLREAATSVFGAKVEGGNNGVD